MAGGVSVDVEAIPFRVTLQKPSTQSNSLFMCGIYVLHNEIQVDLLLRVPFGPSRRDVIRCQLDGQLVDSVDFDTVPIVVAGDTPTEHRRPERALSLNIGSVKDDGLTCDVHGESLEPLPAKF